MPEAIRSIQRQGDGEATRARGLSRRAFLGGTGALVVGFAVPRYLTPAQARAAAAKPAKAPLEGLPPGRVDSWIAVKGNGRITIFTGKAELGTGTATASLQIAAEELDVPLDRLDLVEPDTHRTVDQMYTAGSQTMKTQWAGSLSPDTPWAAGLRQAAAEARTALLGLASHKLGVDASRLVTSNGAVSVNGSPGKSVSYAELIGDRKFERKIGRKARAKPVDRYGIVGTSARRIDIPDKVAAKFQFTQDVTVPGMLHGRVVRPPTIDSTLVSVDRAAHMPGVVKIVVKHNFIGVVAHTEQQAIDAAAKLKPQWKLKPLPDPAKLYDTIRNATPHMKRVLVETLVDSKGAPEAIAGAPQKLSATYRWPYQLHAALGASCAVADVRRDTATVWSSTQGVYPLRDAIATLLGMKNHTIHVIYVEGSGCYGLNGADSVALDAALMSQAVGRPVRVQYMRADEHAWENFGQAMVMEVSAGLDSSGKIVGWDYTTYAASRGGRPGPPGNVTSGGIAGFPVEPTPKSPPPEPPLGPDSSNAVSSYQVPHMRVVSYSVPSRFFTGPLRSPTRIQNTFANESFIDELAAAAKADPVQYRLRHLSDRRLVDVLKAAADMASWTTRPSHSAPGSGRTLSGRGIAAMHYEGTEAYASVVAQVSVDTHSGAITVPHVWAAQDCGLVINPDGMRAQAEGCVIQGISRALKEELKWTPSKVTSVDWASYPILTFTEMPETFDFKIIDRPDIAPVGAGEVVITAMAAAIGNAIHDATGARMRQVPFTPDRVKAALKT